MISKLPIWYKYLKPCTHDCESHYVDEYDTKTLLDDEGREFEIDIIVHHEICNHCDCTLESWSEPTSRGDYPY